MSDQILIFGKDTCPFTTAAREAYGKSGKNFEYVNVLSDPRKLEEMLKLSDGMRRVPVIVENGKVIIGFNGRA